MEKIVDLLHEKDLWSLIPAKNLGILAITGSVWEPSVKPPVTDQDLTTLENGLPGLSVLKLKEKEVTWTTFQKCGVSPIDVLRLVTPTEAGLFVDLDMRPENISWLLGGIHYIDRKDYTAGEKLRKFFGIPFPFKYLFDLTFLDFVLCNLTAIDLMAMGAKPEDILSFKKMNFKHWFMLGFPTALMEK